MPKFNKTVEELETRFEKWLFVLRNLSRLDRIPNTLREKIFEKLFETAEIAKFTPVQVRSYEESLKYYRDLKNSLDTAKEEGYGKGRKQGRKEGRKAGKKEGRKEGIEIGVEKVAKEMLKNNEPIEKIIIYTGLTREQIETLKKEL